MNLSVKNQENYAARKVTLRDFVPIPNRDRIQHSILNGCRVIISKESKAGDMGIFFPVESQIAADFLSKNNLYSDKELNANKDVAGYFQSKGRVRCISLGGAPSEGVLMPLESLIVWNPKLKLSELQKIADNTIFDTIDGESLCQKYVPPLPKVREAGKGKKVKKKVKSRIIPGSYTLHYDTSKFLDNIHILEPEDNLLINSKLHGCNFSMGRIKVLRPLSFVDKIAKFFGAKIIEEEFSNIYASRSVIKNDLPTDKHNHYYGEDVWARAFNELSPYLTDGLSFYGEIVGYASGQKFIQKGYHYGCKEGESKNYIFRITRTSSNGKVEELPMTEVIRFCKARNLNYPEVLFQGKASEFLPQKPEQSLEDWRKDFIVKLRNSFYMEKGCPYNDGKVPFEGCCLRIDGKSEKAFKFKSFLFLKKETEDLDKGEIDTETAESLGSSS
jgi:hypothetical protein